MAFGDPPFGSSNPVDPRFPVRGVPPRLPFSRVGPFGLMILLVAVVLAMAVLGQCGKGTQDDPAGGLGGAGPDHVPREPKIEIVSDEDLPKLDPEGIARETEEILDKWFQTPGRKLIDDRSDDLEPEWILRFGEDDVRNALVNLPPHAFRELEARDRVRAEPGGRRGRLVSLLGEVRESAATEIPGAGGPRPAWKLRLLDDRGDPWVVVSVVEPSPEIAAGRWIRASGVFVKLAPGPLGGASAEERAAFVMHTSQPMIPSFPPSRADALDPAWGAGIDDSTYESSQPLPGSDGDGFWLLGSWLNRLGPAGYAAKVASGEFKPLKVEDMGGPAQKPADFRLRLLRVRLAPVVSQFVTEGVQIENPGHVREVFRGFALDDTGRTVQVFSPFPASAFPKLDGVMVVWAEGYFYKRRAVENRNKPGSAYWMPVFVATRMTPIDPGGRPALDYAALVAWTVIGSIPLLVLLWWALSRKAKREREDAVARHEARLAERRRRGVPTGGGDA